MQRNLLKWAAAFALALVALNGTARAWWNDEWTQRRKVTLDAGEKGAALADAAGAAQVLIRLHDGNFRFDAAKEDGSDVRFVAADDKTALTFHIEKWDALMGEAFVWVKLPEVKPGAATPFWIYYGNSGPKAVKADDAKGTYDAGTALVYHFAEHGTPAMDASGNGANAENAGTPVDGSMIGTGLKLDGKAALTIPTAPPLFWQEGGSMTWSAWIKLLAPQPNAVIFVRREGAKAFMIGADNGVPYAEVTAANGATRRSAAGTALPPNTWHHLAVTAANGKMTVYLDGAEYAALEMPLPGMNSAAMIGGDAEAGSSAEAASEAGFKGEIDELQIAKTARSAAWIKLAAWSQGGDKAASVLTFGEEEGASSWLSTGYFGVIIKNLSVDGWIVIGILAVMACISWYVMYTKVAYLNAIGAGNDLFLREWKHIASDLTVLDDREAEADMVKNMEGRVDKAGQRAMRKAPLFRIYHLGVEEIRHRMAEDSRSGERKGLAGRSIQAIRATLDGGLVRETQRINSKIVLLTICISGGPFLGLLGTVVGVMITFAAVAAAGEVNVNAIAPGIAAALLATVAGLGVAIPSLFGYNYILTRVKEATSEMHVFIDEFVTRMAEFYRE